MIEFSTVSPEIRSLIARRTELNTFLGSVFVAAGIFLRNSLGGNLPGELGHVERHLFGFHAAILMVPSLVLALRMARLHGGLILNGMLYARSMQDQAFTRAGDVERAASHNLLGVSFLQFALADFIAGFSAAVMALTLGATAAVALSGGVATMLACLLFYLNVHRRAAAAARRMIASGGFDAPSRDEWEAHISASLHDANRELIGVISFVGLIVFSVFEVLSGLGQIKLGGVPDLRADDVRRYGPPAYTLLMFVACMMGLMTYLRIRVAVGRFSLELDPEDRPFRPLVLTDSLLGYLLLAFFLALSVHLGAVQIAPDLGRGALAIDAAAFGVAVIAEQITLVLAGRRFGRPAPGRAGAS